MLPPAEELSPEAASPPTSRRRTWVRFAVAFLVGLVAAMAIGADGLYAFDRQYTDRILPGVHVGGWHAGHVEPPRAVGGPLGGLSEKPALLVAGLGVADGDRAGRAIPASLNRCTAAVVTERLAMSIATSPPIG